MSYKGQMSIPGYKLLLENFISNDYKTRKYEDIDKKEKYFILRHDVDIIPEDTLSLAKIEKSYNYKAYYFFMVTSDFYNVNSQNVKNIIFNILSFGHEIGLHFDPKVIKKTNKSIDKIVDEECAILENITQIKIKSISFHRPDLYFLNLNKKIANRYHTYMPEFFSNINYISDSTGLWRYGHPLEHDFIYNHEPFQILIHPEWWNNKKNLGRDEVIKNIYSKLDKNNRNNLENNLSNFSATSLKFED